MKMVKNGGAKPVESQEPGASQIPSFSGVSGFFSCVPALYKDKWPLYLSLSVLSCFVLAVLVKGNNHWFAKASYNFQDKSRAPSSTFWNSGPSKAEMDADANIVCHAYSAQANAVNEFNRYVSLCSSGNNYSDCNSYSANSYRSNVETLKAHFSQQEQAFYSKYGFSFSDKYNCN